MDHKHKLFATASSEAPGACRDSTVDIFSSLPDNLAHHILSDFSFRQFARVGGVSKRCREFYLSTPSLDFSSGDAISRQHHFNLLNYIDRFMNLYGDNRIQRFRIDWDFYAGLSEEVFRIMTWIHIAVRCDVEVLELELRLHESDGVMLELPYCIHLCGSLRSLFINTDTVLKVPSFACYNNLQKLKLRSVRTDEGFCKWISSSCKYLKELWLDHVRVEKFTIESSSLESFTFVYPYNDFCHLSISGEKLVKIKIDWNYYKTSDGYTTSLIICAPNLKYLKWIGNLLNYHNFGKVMCLEKAQIFLKHKGEDYDFDNAFEVLCSICRVKVLILSEATTKLFLREGSMLAAFNDITYLSMHILSLTDDLVPAMVSLLKEMPHLNTLYINSYPSLQRIDKPKARGYNSKYWKSQNLDFIFELKVVSIALAIGYISNAMELARYILEHSPKLKKMFRLYLPHQSYVIKKINKCKIISPAASVIFRKRERMKIKQWARAFIRFDIIYKIINLVAFVDELIWGNFINRPLIFDFFFPSNT